MTLEAALTRKLGIRFIDARTLATESKIRLNVMGYPTEREKEELFAEAVRIFKGKPEKEQRTMKMSREALEQTKIKAGSASSTGRGFEDDTCDETLQSSKSNSTGSGSSAFFRHR